jgi:hypothetical protein
MENESLCAKPQRPLEFLLRQSNRACLGRARNCVAPCKKQQCTGTPAQIPDREENPGCAEYFFSGPNLPRKKGVEHMKFNFLQKQTSRRDILRGSVALINGDQFLQIVHLTL